MADMDIAIEHITPAESGSVAFDVWFRISRLLNRVIALYRPPHSVIPLSGLDSDFPSFEQVIHEMHAWQLLHLPSVRGARIDSVDIHLFY